MKYSGLLKKKTRGGCSLTFLFIHPDNMTKIENQKEPPKDLSLPLLVFRTFNSGETQREGVPSRSSNINTLC